MILFALPVACVGVGMGIWLAYSVHTYWQISDWEEARATILQTELVVHPGDDGATYEVTAKYRYKYNNQAYIGTRVAIGSGSDNIGSFHRAKYEELKKFQLNGDSTRCYVDPSQPSEAILCRDFRWPMTFVEMVFAAAFGSVVST